jgi:sortase (surface protein transpeptidase)
MMALAGMTALCAGAAGLIWAMQTDRPAAASAGNVAIVPAPTGQWAAPPQPTARLVAAPVSLEIPVIGVRTHLIRLGLTASGALAVPPTAAVAGWYTGSPRPGAAGPAVIVGHIDSVSGPGIFYRLRTLRPGELIYVRRADRSLAVFRVTAVRTYLKAHFPTREVYGAVPDAQLRLITCGGSFDYATGHYLSNVIVFATLRTRR